MIQVKIIRDSVVTNSASFPSQEEAQAWLSSHEGMGTFGSPESYSIDMSDISSQVEQERINAESLKLLADTDWYCTRLIDSGTLIPQEILTARAEARTKIVR